MTPQRSRTPEDLFAGLDLAVFEQLANGLFQPVGLLPEWLPRQNEQFDLRKSFPRLEDFLAQCDAAPDSRSDVWTEPDPRGGELCLQAVAILTNGRRFIALKSLPPAVFTSLQFARDLKNEKEKVESLSQEIEVKRRDAAFAMQAKSNFLATMSHEIRTPLNAIIGMADVLSATSLTAEQQKCVDVFQRNGLRLLNLINDILDFSEVESGRIELAAAEMDLHEVIARAIEVIEIRAAAKGLSLRQNMAPGVTRLRTGDATRLRQIIVNLLGNAIKFTEKGGIEVRVEPDPQSADPERLQFAISDTGIGIPQDKLELVFDSFSQADASTTRKYGGTGLGLAISRLLIELMEGRIWAESRAGIGSTFFFTAKIPVQRNQSGSGESPEKRSPAPVTVPVTHLESLVSELRILLADDSDDNRYLILSYLKKSRCTVDIAENGEIAVRMFRAGGYNIVLMDVEMPIMDGCEATREVRRIEKEAGLDPTPVLALTAHALSEMAVKGREAGFTALLTKPIRKITLLQALVQYGSLTRQPPSAASGESANPPRRNRIRVEPGMEDVVPGYLEKRRAEVPVYTEALAAADFDSIRKLAHKMKGTGSGYGFPMLTQLGGALEAAALHADSARVRENLDQLGTYLESIELQYVG